MMMFVNRISEILKDVGQQENVRKKVVIVIIFHSFHVIISPNFTRQIVIRQWARFVFYGITKCFDRWELHFCEFLGPVIYECG